MKAVVADLRGKLDAAMQGGSEEARARHVARGKLLARERVDLLLDPGIAVPRAVAARRLRHVWRRRPFRQPDHRHRPHQRPRMRRRRQRRHHQGRHLLSHDGEEAPAGAGDRAREPSALHLPGRFRRRVPAAAGRDLSRRAPLRPHLLQPGPHVGAGHSADRDRDGLVHRRRRLRAGDVRREHHRAQSGHDLSRRAAAGEGGDRRGGERGGLGRRRRPQPAIRRHRLLRDRRRPCHRHRAPHRRQPQPREAALSRAASAARAALSGGGDLRHRAGRPAHALRRPRRHRAHRRRLRARRVQGALRPDAGLRLRPHPRLSRRHPRQQRHPVQRERAQGRALHRAGEPAQHSAASSCRTSPASWSAANTRPEASPRTAPRW